MGGEYGQGFLNIIYAVGGDKKTPSEEGENRGFF
jgi:hypothetical protein